VVEQFFASLREERAGRGLGRGASGINGLLSPALSSFWEEREKTFDFER
jgi:hypothetical protein